MSEQKITLPAELVPNTTAAVIPLNKNDKRPPIVRAKIIKLSWFAKNALALSAVLCVIIPGILASIFFLTIASDRYVAGAGFAVRTMDSAPVGGELLGALSGIGGATSTVSDSYIIQKFIHSRELIDQLVKNDAFIEAYSTDKADFIYRLDPNDPIEDIQLYWEGMADVFYDNSSELIEFQVEAFTAEDAEKMALAITQYSQDLINRLSEKARNDAVRFSKREVAAAEVRLKLSREELRNFRAVNKAVDPAASAAALIELTTTVEAQIIEQRARLSILQGSLSESSPSIQDAKNQIAALERQLAAKRGEISGSSAENQNLAELLSDYERLLLEQEFAQQAYTVTLASLERARAEADRQQRFLAVFQKPVRPASAIYPYRGLSSVLAFIIAFIIWAIGVFLFSSVRDHLR